VAYGAHQMYLLATDTADFVWYKQSEGNLNCNSARRRVGRYLKSPVCTGGGNEEVSVPDRATGLAQTLRGSLERGARTVSGLRPDQGRTPHECSTRSMTGLRPCCGVAAARHWPFQGLPDPHPVLAHPRCADRFLGRVHNDRGGQGHDRYATRLGMAAADRGRR
jgi:hypothetical protein